MVAIAPLRSDIPTVAPTTVFVLVAMTSIETMPVRTCFFRMLTSLCTVAQCASAATRANTAFHVKSRLDMTSFMCYYVR